jgi:hypothetical protein
MLLTKAFKKSRALIVVLFHKMWAAADDVNVIDEKGVG